MDWTVRVLHGFWDSWLHERDVLLAQGIEHPTDGDATGYAAAYGLFIAAAVALLFGARVQEKLTLGGDGGGVFELDSSNGVTLTATRVTTAGPPAAQVTNAVAGRAPVASILGDLPADSRAALSSLKERGRVKRGVCGFCPGSRTVTGHAGLARGRPPGAWAFPVSRLLPIRVSGSARVKDRAGPGRRSRRRRRP